VLEFKRRLNATPFESCVTATQLYALLEQVASAEPALNIGVGNDPVLRKQVRQRYAESNEAVRRRWFPDQPTLFATSGPAMQTVASDTVAGSEGLAAVANALDRLHGGLLGQTLLSLIGGPGAA
jgi:hypothetical protein